VVKNGGATEIAVSRTGTLAYVTAETPTRLVRVDRSGAVRGLTEVPRQYSDPRISPNGKQIAFVVQESGSRRDIWVYGLTGSPTRLTRDGRSTRPTWTGDGQRIAWLFTEGGRDVIRWQAWDGSGKPETLTPPNQNLRIADFARTGSFFVAMTRGMIGSGDVWMGSLGATPEFRSVLSSPAIEVAPKLSPDGHWLAYTSDESGRWEVYVTSLSAPTDRHQISTNGGSEPVWAPDGRALFYRSSSQMMSASIVTSPAFEVVRRDSLFRDTFVASGEFPAYDVFPDGKDFVMLQRGEERQRVVVVVGWLDELRERMAPGKK
jgi:YD repeat-containing protein